MSVEHEIEDIKRRQDEMGKRQDIFDREQAKHEERSRATINMYKDLKEIVLRGFEEIKTVLSASVPRQECVQKEVTYQVERDAIKARLTAVEQGISNHQTEHKRNSRQINMMLVGWLFTIALAAFTVLKK